MPVARPANMVRAKGKNTPSFLFLLDGFNEICRMDEDLLLNFNELFQWFGKKSCNCSPEIEKFMIEWSNGFARWLKIQCVKNVLQV